MPVHSYLYSGVGSSRISVKMSVRISYIFDRTFANKRKYSVDMAFERYMGDILRTYRLFLWCGNIKKMLWSLNTQV